LPERYFAEPYQFVKPYPGTLWCRLLRPLAVRQLRRSFGVARWHFEGLEHLHDSLARGAGILLASNHCRLSDPSVLGVLGTAVGRYPHYLASFHLFKQGRFAAWVRNRMGGYSIRREGIDRESLRASAHILAEGKRPLVLFPEGTWFRQNDRVGPLQDGVALIARQAARQASRPIHVHPVGLKYWLLEDPRPELTRRLEQLERGLGWQPQDHLGLLDRIDKLGGALLAVKEIEHFGQAQPGTLDERIAALADSYIGRLEKGHLGREHTGWPLERIRRLRLHLVGRLAEVADDAEEFRRTRRALEDLLFCENLSAQSREYLRERPSFERLTETVLRIEETVHDAEEAPIAPMGAAVTVGPALDSAGNGARAARRGPEPLVAALREAIQGLLDGILAQGPPAAWRCPPALEKQPSWPGGDRGR
jgi:hypothetical protein